MEGERRRPATPLEKASLEGTIRMPQVGLGIRLHAAEHCLSSEDPKQSIAELIAPIPLDERLSERTKKANAQHGHFNIGRTLTDQDVRRVLAAGNLQTLTLIGETLGHYLTGRHLITFDVDGTWADPELETYAAAVQHELTPERIQQVQKVFRLTTEVLTDPEIVTLLKERKDTYRNYKDMNDFEKRNTRSESSSAAEEVQRRVIDKLYEARAQASSPEEEEMFKRVIFTMKSTTP